jgi:uncharacterized protein YceK
MSKLKVFLFVMLISGCASPVSSNVHQVGENLYTTSANMDGVKLNNEENSAKTRSKALETATKYCVNEKQSKYASIVKEDVSKGPTATAVIFFNFN